MSKTLDVVVLIVCQNHHAVPEQLLSTAPPFSKTQPTMLLTMQGGPEASRGDRKPHLGAPL